MARAAEGDEGGAHGAQESRMREHVEALEAHDACKPSSGSSRRKRKKGKKRRLPRSSVPRHGRARRRERQWHAPGWFSSVWPKFLGFFVGTDQKDSSTVALVMFWLVLLVTMLSALCFLSLSAGQWHVQGWCTLCGMFPSVFGRLVMLGFMAGMDQKGCAVFAACRRHPFRGTEADPHGPDYSADHRDSPVAVRFQVVNVPVVQVVLAIPVTMQYTVEVPQLLFIKVVDNSLHNTQHNNNTTHYTLHTTHYTLHTTHYTLHTTTLHHYTTTPLHHYNNNTTTTTTTLQLQQHYNYNNTTTTTTLQLQHCSTTTAPQQHHNSTTTAPQQHHNSTNNTNNSTNNTTNSTTRRFHPSVALLLPFHVKLQRLMMDAKLRAAAQVVPAAGERATPPFPYCGMNG